MTESANETERRALDGRSPLDLALLRTVGGATPEGLSDELEARSPCGKVEHTKAMTEVAFLLRGATRDRELAQQPREAASTSTTQVSGFPSFGSVYMKSPNQKSLEDVVPKASSSTFSSSLMPQEMSSQQTPLDVSIKSLTSLCSVSTCVSRSDA